MEERIRNRYHEKILSEAMKRYEINQNEIQLLDGFESYIFEYKRDERHYILRLSHSLRRTPELILGEIDWINYLARKKAGVAYAVESSHGHLVERIPDGMNGEFLATSFVKAPGRHMNHNDWNHSLIYRYGLLLGQMHRFTVDYAPTRSEWIRPAWNDPLMLEVESYLPDGSNDIIFRYRNLLNRLEMLPKNKEIYGLIHQDAHAGNFFVTDTGEVTLFDFDDCAYSWFANDIAIVFFYAWDSTNSPDRFVENFVIPFLSGYRSEFSLKTEWLEWIPDFLKLREIDMYAIIHRSFGDSYEMDPWCRAFMKDRKEKIEQDTPFIDYDFARLI